MTIERREWWKSFKRIFNLKAATLQKLESCACSGEKCLKFKWKAAFWRFKHQRKEWSALEGNEVKQKHLRAFSACRKHSGNVKSSLEADAMPFKVCCCWFSLGRKFPRHTSLFFFCLRFRRLGVKKKGHKAWKGNCKCHSWKKSNCLLIKHFVFG